jgi:hypothetical protein
LQTAVWQYLGYSSSHFPDSRNLVDKNLMINQNRDIYRGSCKHILDWTDQPDFIVQLLQIVRSVQRRLCGYIPHDVYAVAFIPPYSPAISSKSLPLLPIGHFEGMRPGAVLDRLTHRCHIIEMRGESYRLKDAKRRRKKEPDELTQADSGMAL